MIYMLLTHCANGDGNAIKATFSYKNELVIFLLYLKTRHSQQSLTRNYIQRMHRRDQLSYPFDVIHV